MERVWLGLQSDVNPLMELQSLYRHQDVRKLNARRPPDNTC
jgi:hypothetical protein